MLESRVAAHTYWNMATANGENCHVLTLHYAECAGSDKMSLVGTADDAHE